MAETLDRSHVKEEGFIWVQALQGLSLWLPSSKHLSRTSWQLGCVEGKILQIIVDRE